MPKLQLDPRAQLSATDRGAVLASPTGRFQLKGSDSGQFVARIAPLLDGSRSEQEIVDALPGYTPESVGDLLDLLRRQGLLREVEADALESRAAAHIAFVGLEGWAFTAAIHLANQGVGRITLWDDQGLRLDEAQALSAIDPTLAGHAARRLGWPRQQVLGELLNRRAMHLRLDVEPMPEAFCRADMGRVHAFEPAPSLVVVASRPEALLQRFQAARAIHATGLAGLSAHMERTELWLGPAVLGAQRTPCWNCLRMRRLAVDDQIVHAHSVQGQLIRSTLPPMTPCWFSGLAPAAGRLLADTVLDWLASPSPELLGRVRIHELQRGTATLHGVAPMPWCPVCEGAQGALDRARDADGTCAAAMEPALGRLPANTVEELVARMEGWVDPRFGILRSLRVQSTGPLVSATTQLAHFTEGDTRRVAPGALGGGKGFTAFEAQVGAIGEAVERYSAARYRPADLHLARLDELDGEAIDPRRLCFYDDAVYRSSENPYVPFDPAVPIHWLKGHWFGTGDPVWVPAVATLFGMHAEPHEQLLQISSSGLAAGSSTVDASLRAVFELLERDATMLTWLCRLPGRPIALDDSLDDTTAQVVRQLESGGTRVELYLLDVGNGLPTVFGVARGKKPAAAASLACHGDPGVAARKAILELAQVLPYLASIPPQRIPATREAVRTLEDHAFYYLPATRAEAFDFLSAGDEPAIPLAELTDPDYPEDVEAATEVVAAKIRRAGLRIATVDLTSPDTRLTPWRVARAVGLDVQPIHFGFSLRPVTNPRLRERLGPRQLHPRPHPIA